MVKIPCFAAALLISGLFANAATPAAAGHDFLQYRRLKAQVMERTPFDCGRLVLVPSYERAERYFRVPCSDRKRARDLHGDSYIRREKPAARDELRPKYRARAARADQQAGRGNTAADRVAATKVWLQMLKDPQQTLYNRSSEDVSKDSDAERVVVLDGPSFEWSLQRDSGATLKAELNVALDFSPRAERFAHITAVLLDKYCRARSDARPGIAEMIEAQARQLLAIRN